MILSDEQLKKVGAANQGRYMQSLVTNLMDTIADLRRQLAELDRMIAVITKMPGSGALDAYVQEHAKAAYDSGYIAGADSVLSKVQEKVDRAVLAESEWWLEHSGYSDSCEFCRDRLTANRAKLNP